MQFSSSPSLNQHKVTLRGVKVTDLYGVQNHDQSQALNDKQKGNNPKKEIRLIVRTNHDVFSRFVERPRRTGLLHQPYQLQHSLTLSDYLAGLLQDSTLQSLKLVVGCVRRFSL